MSGEAVTRTRPYDELLVGAAFQLVYAGRVAVTACQSLTKVTAASQPDPPMRGCVPLLRLKGFAQLRQQRDG
ncbi:MAG TPA: hypothetical protein DEF45_19265 [Rhodopirellula sp.]|nr:hypothetical protein [Rhodopirellula sp.]